MSTTYLDMVLQEARLVILRVLCEANAFTSNSSLLVLALDAYGVSLTRDQMDAQIAWLAEQALVTSERVATVTRATITGRGEDVATGRAACPGVKRPGPRR